MKKMKKLASLILAMVMVIAMTLPVCAANETSHTITITNEKGGHTYQAYQVFKGDISNRKLTNIEWGAGVDEKAVLADLVQVEAYKACKTAEDVAEVLASFSNDSAQLDAFAEVVGKHLSSTVAGTSTESSSPYKINVEGDGYYLVKDVGTIGTGDAATKYILNVVGDVSVQAKADAPELEKKIVEGDQRVDANNGSVGDVVDYELTSTVPAMDGYDKYYFIVHDTLSDGLTFNNNVTITVGAKTLAKDKDFTVTQNGQTIKIVFDNFIQYKANVGAAIVINYSATINEKAVIGNVGNTNTVKLEYSNNPNISPSGKNEPGSDDKNVTGETPEDTVITYLTGIELVKVDENGNRLTGAEFEISGEKLNKVKTVKEVFAESTSGTYYKLKDGTYTETAPTDATSDQYESVEVKYTKGKKVEWTKTKESVPATAAVDSDGVLRFEGLAEGTYVIHEIKAPAGYNLLKDDITVVITCTEPESVATKNDQAEWKYTISGAVTADDTTANDGIVHITVENKAGATLPSTGGMGTTLFYVIGGIMVLGAGILLVTRRRMHSK